MKSHLIIITLLCALSVLNVNAQPSNQYAKTNKMLKEKYGNLIGMKVKKVIKKLNLDTTQFYIGEEPPFILSHLTISLNDTLQLTCYIGRTAIPITELRQRSKPEYEYVKSQKVKGISVFDNKARLTYNLKK